MYTYLVRKFITLLIVLCLLLLSIAIVLFVRNTEIDKIYIRRINQSIPPQNKSVIVAIDTTKGTKQDLLNSIKSGYYEVYYEYDTLPGFAMHVDSEVYAFLQNSELVKRMGFDELSEPLK